MLDFSTKGKLAEIAEATGGRSFVISNADDLLGVYERIESELRSQYLLAYAPPPGGKNEYRRVQVKVNRRGAKARTIPGYSP
jgi:hypothetical protein